MQGYDDAGYWRDRALSAEQQVDDMRTYVRAANEALQLVAMLRELLGLDAPATEAPRG